MTVGFSTLTSGHGRRPVPLRGLRVKSKEGRRESAPVEESGLACAEEERKHRLYPGAMVRLSESPCTLTLLERHILALCSKLLAVRQQLISPYSSLGGCFSRIRCLDKRLKRADAISGLHSRSWRGCALGRGKFGNRGKR
ncbi:hypothetical protein KM043_017273 [Ampulex compressa]|nr:hypothetical protein KM043_017273 [Ampulex compressa]